MIRKRRLDLFEGAITGLAFATGHAVVVGAWARSPFGTFVDVMWRQPNGHRVLLASSATVIDYVAGLYDFDEVAVVPLRGGICGDELTVAAGPLLLHAEAAAADWRSWLFAMRPRVLRRSPVWISVEDAIARPVIGTLLGGGEGVRAAGTAPGGQREFYGADDWRRIATARLEVEGTNAGPLVDPPADLGVGLSSFPTRPAMVRVGTLIASHKG